MKLARLRRLCRHGTLTQLAVFEAVARHGSITRAAEEMCLAQPTVSLQMKKLAEGVGAPLLEPGNRGLRLTDAGREVYAACEDVFARLTEMQDRVSDLQDRPPTTLRLAASSTAKYIMPRLLGAFWQANPAVRIVFDVMNRARLITRLHSGADDFYVFSNPPEDMELKLHRLTPNPLCFFARRDHPLAMRPRISLAEIASQPFIMREAGSGTRMAAEQLFAEHRIEPVACIELGSNEAVKQGLRAGLGVSLLSRHVLGPDSDRSDLVELDVVGMPLLRHWYLAHSATRELTPMEKAFVEHATSWSYSTPSEPGVRVSEIRLPA